MRVPQEYDRLTDAQLDVIFGQHVGGYICDLPAMGNAPDCNLYGRQAHYAPDDWNMPHPIGAGGEDYDAALERARELFGGLQVDTVLITNSRHEVYVTRATQTLPGDDERKRQDPARFDSDVWNHGTERDRWVSVRRCVIKCILALTDAPITPTIRTATVVRES